MVSWARGIYIPNQKNMGSHLELRMEFPNHIIVLMQKICFPTLQFFLEHLVPIDWSHNKLEYDSDVDVIELDKKRVAILSPTHLSFKSHWFPVDLVGKCPATNFNLGITKT